MEWKDDSTGKWLECGYGKDRGYFWWMEWINETRVLYTIPAYADRFTLSNATGPSDPGYDPSPEGVTWVKGVGCTVGFQSPCGLTLQRSAPCAIGDLHHPYLPPGPGCVQRDGVRTGESTRRSSRDHRAVQCGFVHVLHRGRNDWWQSESIGNV
eukprot:TRINITY_DN56572_c0_g1_i1.p1 TRINITY_DN56572_c0_g1~~TRINITY_DN56572_c0_g1_i1.p1  ORF type:complete len:168 (+),score=3.80 TRINITY_DN56572_c0_g1_i1:45-506(+)